MLKLKNQKNQKNFTTFETLKFAQSDKVSTIPIQQFTLSISGLSFLQKAEVTIM